MIDSLLLEEDYLCASFTAQVVGAAVSRAPWPLYHYHYYYYTVGHYLVRY